MDVSAGSSVAIRLATVGGNERRLRVNRPNPPRVGTTPRKIKIPQPLVECPSQNKSANGAFNARLLTMIVKSKRKTDALPKLYNKAVHESMDLLAALLPSKL